MEGHAAPVRMIEIDGDASRKLPKLAARARIADRIDGEGDMRSRGIDPIIRRRASGHAGLCKDANRQDRADDAGAPDSTVACCHMLLTHTGADEHSRRAAYSFPLPGFTYSLLFANLEGRRTMRKRRISDSLFDR